MSEEDIEILENSIKEVEDNKDIGFFENEEDLKFYNAVKHLIKAYKELEEENKELKAKAAFKLYISGMQNGKELFKKTLADYNDLSIKVLKLQNTTNYTIDNLIDLFLKGYTLQKDYIPKAKVEEEIGARKYIMEEYKKKWAHKDEKYYRAEIEFNLLQELLKDGRE